MAKKVHLLDAGGKSLCGTQPKSKRKGTLIPRLVTCSNCLRKLEQIKANDPGRIRYG